jgi:hypothetical protein
MSEIAMKSRIRDLYKQKYSWFGGRPGWFPDKYVKRADSINQNLGLGSFQISEATNPLEDIRAALDIAIKSKYLNGLYDTPRFANNGKSIVVGFEKDLYTHTDLAVKMIQIALACADVNGKLALPSSLQVQLTKGERTLIIFIVGT